MHEDTRSLTQRTRAAGQIAAFGLCAAGLAVILAVVAIFVASNGNGGTKKAAAAPKTVDVELGDLYVKPKSLEVPAGTVLTVSVHNAGQMQHDLKLDGTTGTRLLGPGEHQTVELGAIDASTSAWCTVPGHREAGMEMKITATGGATDGAAQASTASASAAAANPDDAKIDVDAKPDASWTARDPKAPAALPGTVHELTMETRETELEVAPGVKQQMWTFNLVGEQPTVPGPILRGKVGDTFKITLVNKGSVGHSIDFHASKVAWNDKMRTINPGESLVYEFTADYAGAFMYHCGTNPTLHHIGNGMYGAVIIDPADLAPVDHEYVLVQSELYTGPQGQPGDLTKMKNEQWDAVVFNGYVNQYKHQPIRVEPNQRVRVWVVDDGPSENSAFHIVGTIFDTTWKEGTYLLRPDARQGGSQVLDLQPAQGGFVEFSFAEKGLYPIVTHKFANVGKGALGLFQAGDVPPPAGGASH
ncbi:MAG: multicopper oxidase domain-containing protein [Acidimicrobiales bacterium]